MLDEAKANIATNRLEVGVRFEPADPHPVCPSARGGT